MPQLMSTSFHSATALYSGFRYQYQAVVMNMLDTVSRIIVYMTSLSQMHCGCGIAHWGTCRNRTSGATQALCPELYHGGLQVKRHAGRCFTWLTPGGALHGSCRVVLYTAHAVRIITLWKNALGQGERLLKTVELIVSPPVVRIIDQRMLPGKLAYRDLDSREDVFDAIKTLAVRGAPAIGIAAAFGLAREALDNDDLPPADMKKLVRDTGEYLKKSRPTAVNLSWAVDRIVKVAAKSRAKDGSALAWEILADANAILDEDLSASRKMGAYGAKLIKDGANCLTHCNAGGLATGGLGTALAVFYSAKEQGKKIHVYADETRPLLQGARLTAFELKENGIPVTLITDNMAGALMKSGKIDAVFVGADRIAANGDAANKIGTYSVAVLAKHHKVPFYVVAPLSTFDINLKSGDEIPIEERTADEVRGFRDVVWAPDVEVWNPAFDVTPNELIAGIVTEVGVLRKPYKRSIGKALKG
jgi:methylthioribose-1-phosphate isomerase